MRAATMVEFDREVSRQAVLTNCMRFPRESSSTYWCWGAIIASGIPGRPAPVPTSMMCGPFRYGRMERLSRM